MTLCTPCTITIDWDIHCPTLTTAPDFEKALCFKVRGPVTLDMTRVTDGVVLGLGKLF